MYLKYIGKIYRSELAADWCSKIVDDINKRIKERKVPCYKHVVEIMLGQQTGSECRYIGKCFWDSSSDTKVSGKYQSDSMFCVVTVFGAKQF